MQPQTPLKLVFLITMLSFPAIQAHGGGKAVNEECANDSDCNKGHCYTKKSDGKKVCVDCDASTISETRKMIDEWCHNKEKKCNKCVPPKEVWEENYKISIDAFSQCIKWRKKENDSCWGGGNAGHREAVDINEAGKRNCEDYLSDCKGNGFTFTCSESTYNSKNDDAKKYCISDQNEVCKQWQKDEKKVDCRAIQDARDLARQCVSTVDSLKSSCLDRLSRYREGQRGRASSGYSSCNELYEYKEKNKLCN